MVFAIFRERKSSNNKKFAQKIVPFVDGKKWVARV
jgi:hypothetical protein